MATKKTTKRTTKKAAPKKTAAKKAAPKQAETKKDHMSINPAAILFALVILMIGILGWYILSESQKVNDEYDEADQANSTLLKRSDVENGDDEVSDSEEEL